MSGRQASTRSRVRAFAVTSVALLVLVALSPSFHGFRAGNPPTEPVWTVADIDAPLAGIGATSVGLPFVTDSSIH